MRLVGNISRSTFQKSGRVFQWGGNACEVRFSAHLLHAVTSLKKASISAIAA